MLKRFKVAYFMASTDDAATNRKFAEANNADFPILSDPDGTTATAYGVMSVRGYASRWTYFIDSDGLIAHIDKSVSPLNAGQDIASRLEALGVSQTP